MNIWILFWVFVVLLLVVEIPMFVGGFSAAPWLPTSRKDLPRINKLAGLKPGQVFVDIGCGDGRICNYIADMNPRAVVYGYEIAYPLYLLCRLKALHRKNVHIHLKDIMKVDFSKFDVVYLWGVPRGVDMLKPKFEEMKKGSKIILVSHEIKGWEPEKVEQPTPQDPKLLLYAV